ncbi:MAG TPA: NAD(P)/FAD-dependent oxidoreductase [Sandaracinaceae bacterium LLY-WYZ-13_1]|nr:NAD(P)/FAD-dependent oxidoreductase [Sandaracinaceae bacterium LLY-WYZ-13_1]
MSEHFDVLVVGAGISGIGAGYHLQTECPTRSYAILEGREDLGGTWDLFRYPGIRSDSDMHTLGFSFRPWEEAEAIADGPAILRYLKDTAREHGIDRHIRFGHTVTKASWSSDEDRWTVDAVRHDTGEAVRLTCEFLFACCGYYDYEEGYTPDFPGIDRFAGRVVHPQQWTEDIEYAGERVVVIGSGATAVTLVPELAKEAAHVTMLQRTPTYIVSRPTEDKIANALRDKLPPHTAYAVTRWKNVLLGQLLFTASRRAPRQVRELIKKGVRQALGEGYDVETHFDPPYDPWDQRLCLAPDGDFFEAIRSGTVSVVTDHVETFTDNGVRLRSGRELEADLVVTATGLKVRFLGGIALEVDGRDVEPADTMSYKGAMFSDVPNLAVSFGYTNASWTLKADLTAAFVCRVLNHMERHGYHRVVPRRESDVAEEPFVDLSSGYIQRALDILPKQGSRAPWRVHQNYLLDRLAFRLSKVDDGVLELR